jgi:hypothetical protein
MSNTLQYDLSPPICSLLRTSCPATILSRIAAIIVDSINRVIFAGSFSHIGKKGCKIVGPTLADYYASASIICKGIGIRIIASSLYRQPNVIFALSIESVFSAHLAEFFIMKTAARTRTPPSKAMAGDYFCVAAITSASRGAALLGRYDKATKSETNGRFHYLNNCKEQLGFSKCYVIRQ